MSDTAPVRCPRAMPPVLLPVPPARCVAACMLLPALLTMPPALLLVPPPALSVCVSCFAARSSIASSARTARLMSGSTPAATPSDKSRTTDARDEMPSLSFAASAVPPDELGMICPDCPGLNSSGPFSPTRYVPPARTGPPAARAPSIVVTRLSPTIRMLTEALAIRFNTLRAKSASRCSCDVAPLTRSEKNDLMLLIQSLTKLLTLLNTSTNVLRTMFKPLLTLSGIVLTKNTLMLSTHDAR